MATLQELLELQGGQQQQAIPTVDTNRSLGEWIGDTGISALNAVIGVPKAIAGLGQILPGVNFVADPFVNWVEQGQEALYAKQSPQAKAARQEMLTAAQEGRIIDAAGSALTNPANLVDLAASGIASLGGMKLLGMGAGALAGGKNFLSPYATAFLNKSPAFQAGALEGLYTAGASADALVDPEQLYNPGRLAAIPLGAITGAIGGASAKYFPEGDIEARVLGGAAAPTLARNVVGPDELGRTALDVSPAGTLLRRMMSDPRAYVRAPMQGLKEAGEEFFQSTQEAMWPQAVMEGQVNFDQALAEGVLGAIPGAMIGGVYGIRNAPTEPPARPAQGQPVPPNAAEESWLQEQERTLGRAIPTPEREAMLKAFRAQGYQGNTNIATGQGISVPSTAAPPLAPITTTTYADLLANRPPQQLTTEDYILRDQLTAEAAQREADRQQWGVAVGGKGYTGAKTPAEGLRVIPPSTVPVSAAEKADIVAQFVASGFSPEQAEAIAARIPAQHLPPAQEAERGAWPQQALSFEFAPTARDEALRQVNVARETIRDLSKAKPTAPSTPTGQEQFGLFDSLDQATEGMSLEQAQQFLDDFRKREIASQIAQGKNPIQAAQYANTIVGITQQRHADKVAALQAQQQTATEQLATAEATTNEALAAAIARQEAEQAKAGRYLGRRKGFKQIQTAGENRVGFKAPRGTKGAVEPLANAVYGREPDLVALREEEAYAEAAIADLDQKIAEIKANKPVARVTGGQESLNRRIDAEATRLLQVRKAVNASVNNLAAKLENPETPNAITRRADAQAAAREQLKELIKQYGTDKYSDFKTARAVAVKNIAAQDKAAAAAKPAETPYGVEAAPAKDKATLMREGKQRARIEEIRQKVEGRGETTPATTMKGTWEAKYKADLAAEKAGGKKVATPTPKPTPKPTPTLTEEEAVTPAERTPEERETQFKASKKKLSKASRDEVDLAMGEIDAEQYGDTFKDIVIDLADKLDAGPNRNINHDEFTRQLANALKAAGIERTAEAKKRGKGKDKEATVVDDKAVLDSMAPHIDKYEAAKTIWEQFDEQTKLKAGRDVLARLKKGNPKEPVSQKEFNAAWNAMLKAGVKGGFKGFEIAEDDTTEDILKKLSRAQGKPQPIVTDDKTVSALATLIDNPNADVEDGFLPLKEKMQRLAKATKEFEDDTRLTELGIALELGKNEQDIEVIKIVRGKGANYTKADTEQEIIDLVAKDLDVELDSIKTILQDIYSLVEGGKETVNAAQAASKGATVEADFRVQTSPAIRFSIYNKLYQQDNLVPWMINDIGWRVNVNQIKQQGEENPVTNNTQLAEENAGRLTTRTQFGYIALGENVKNTTNGKKAYDETVQGARTAVRQMLPKASEEKVVELAKQHAATRLILKEIIRSNPSPFMKRLAGILERTLFDTGLMYRMKVSYFPHTQRNQKADHAEYVFVKDGIDPGVDLHEIRVYGQDLLLKTGGGKNVLINNVQARHFLHEVVHAITAAYVTNNQTSAEAKLFQQLREIKAVNDAMANLYPKWDTYSDLRKTLEFIAAGLTDRNIANTLRGITLTSDNEHKGIFAAINALIKEPGKALLNTYKGFVKVVRSLFGIRRQDNADLTNGFDAFLNTFTSAARSVSKLAVENEKADQAAYRVMAPDTNITLTSPGAALEAEYFEQKAKEEAAIQKQIWEDKQKEKLSKPAGLRPSQERAITEGKSAAVDFARRNMNSLNQRNGYDAVDKLGEFLFSWIPTNFEKYAGPDGAYLKERLHQLIDSRPTLSRVVAGLVDGYGIPHRFKINMFNKTKRLSMLNNLVGQIVNNPNLSFDEKLQQEFYDYLAGKTNTISDHILMRLAKEFKQTVNEARDLGVLDDTLKNANYEDVLAWNKSKMLENMRGFEFSSARKGMVNIRNGHVENGIDKFLGVSVGDVGAKVNAWWQKVPDANNTGGFRVTHAFVDASKSYAQQKKLVEDTYGTGWEQAPNVWYVLSDGQSKVAYRPFTFAERKAVDKNASFIRSIAFTMYGLERKLTGIKLNDEMIAENKDLKNEEKFLFENTPENLAWLQEELKKRGSKNRILYYEQAKLDNEQKLMRTPGNWVVLKGTRWGSLDDAKEGVSYIVPSTVFMAIEDYNNANNIIDSKTLRFINRIWKKNMTVWSTTGHTTNVLSNFIICYYNDIHPQDILKALKIIWRVKYRPKEATAEDWAFYEEAEARGAMLGTMASEELAETMENQIKELEKLELKGNSLTDYVKAATATSGIFLNYIRTIANKTDSKLSDAYANEDNVFRLAAYLSKVNQVVVAKGGETLTEAELEDIGMWASEVMVNYNINAKYVKFARETVLPFIAWPYRMVGQLAKLAVEKPWKLANTLAVVYALDALAYAMLGASGDDDDEERKNLAPYMKESIWNTSVAPSYVRMPFGKLMEKGYFFGAGRIVPLGDLMVINDGMAVPQTLAAGGPIALMMQAMFNMDFFKREAIMKEGAPALDKMEDLVTFLWRGSAPAITTRAWDAFDKVISGKQGPLGSEATSYIEIARLLGLNVREVDFAEAAYNKSIADRNALQKIKSYARQKIGQELRYPMPDMKAIQSINDNMFGALNDFWSTR